MKVELKCGASVCGDSKTPVVLEYCISCSDLIIEPLIEKTEPVTEVLCSVGLGSANPTLAQVESVCLSFRHDYGLMDDEAKKSLQFQATEWLHAWLKEFGLK